MSSEDQATASGALCPACGGWLRSIEDDCPSCTATAAAVGAPSMRPEFTGPKELAHYRILRELGAGGMGTVFEAHDRKMDRRVALKILSRHHAPSEKAELRFEQEAWIAGRLSHPNLVQVYDRGSWEELSYYSMELVDGGSLADTVGSLRRWGKDDRLGLVFGTVEYLHWAIRRVIDAARGLDHAHQRGVVHRDVKPGNLLIDRAADATKIADFGLAIDQDATRMTTAGKILGTLSYMAPEQILGKQDEIDARTDVYALGVTLFELVTLVLPFRGETQQMYINAVLTSEARRPRALNEQVGRDLEIVIRKALEKERQDRYATAADLADDLENVLHLRPIRARPPGAAERATKWVRRKPLHAALAATLVFGIPLIGVLGQRALDQRRLERAATIQRLERDVRWLWQRGHEGELIDPATEILRLDPDHPRALQTRIGALVVLAGEAGSPAEAAEFQARALDDLDRLAELQPAAAWPRRLAAFALRRFGREDEAAERDRHAVELSSGDPSYTDAYFDGLLALEQQDPERAVASLSEALALQPSSWDPLAPRARALEQLDRLEEAIQDYRVAVALNPEDAVGQFNLGRLLTRVGKAEEGLRYIRRVADSEPGNPLVGQALADNALQRGRSALSSGDRARALELFREAERHARSSLESGGEDPITRLDLGASLMEQNRLSEVSDPAKIDEAIDLYESALELLESSPSRSAARTHSAVLVNTCDALIQAAALDQALAVCGKAAELRGDDPVSFYNLAGVHARLGRFDEAFDALERDFALGDRDWRYLEADPWFAEIRSDPRFSALLARMKPEAGAP